LARAGVAVTVLEAAATIGGGTRSSEYLAPGLLHDQCSAVHPMAVASPLFKRLELPGITWRAPDVDCAHPLDDGTAGAFCRSFDRTEEALGVDGRRWRRLFEPVAAHFDDLFEDISQPLLRVPRHPVTLARFGMRAALPATVLGRVWRTPQARALWSGVAAHAFWPLNRPMTSAIGSALTAAAHAHGWVVAEGGSQAIADALAADVIAHGGTIETGITVEAATDLPPHDLLMLDVSPSVALAILGNLLPGRIAKAYRRFAHGPGAFKVDFAVEGGVPWTAEVASRAGTVHLGGSSEEIVAAELAVHRGTMPERPFVLVGQQYLADPQRSSADVHPLWTYAHVPHGYRGDATKAIVAQIERFAPGFRDRLVGTAVRSATAMAKYNPNYVGGDIIGGASSMRQTIFRPRVAIDPYATGISGVYLCSASTPPGAGAHGMCGANAAARALAHVASPRAA
jgi:phytoene dehydrogenase-like protein